MCLIKFANILYHLIAIPFWLLYPASHYRENLDCLTVVQLQESAQCVDQFPPQLKESVIDCFLMIF